MVLHPYVHQCQHIILFCLLKNTSDLNEHARQHSGGDFYKTVPAKEEDFAFKLQREVVCTHTGQDLLL